MKNDKQIAFIELSFQPFSGKFVTIVRCSKPISRNVSIHMLSLWDILPTTKSVILTAMMTKNSKTFIIFFDRPDNYAYVTMTSQKVVLGIRLLK